MASEQTNGPPYVPNTASVGGTPTIDVDIPICSVFILLYLAGAITNQIVFQRNRIRHHKFLMSWALFGFSMVRVLTFSLRIAWACELQNVSLGIAAGCFTHAGVLILYVINLLLALRILRATHPHIGWNRPLHGTLIVNYYTLVFALLIVVAFLVVSFYTLQPSILTASKWLGRLGGLYILFFALIPIVFIAISICLPRKSDQENFGQGSMKTKMIIAGMAIFFCTCIECFRFATAWTSPRPKSHPAWYDSKEAFYIIEFGFEIIVLYLYSVTRFDRRFWVPNGSKGPGDYSSTGQGAKIDGPELA